ncbi:M1 family metallopeptidase [Daejeonella sp.]|uniref:M1 family metallopeptidase n=1 Tax=Daejeonella sp. TaxID=2805397 RepID=UPI003983826D
MNLKSTLIVFLLALSTLSGFGQNKVPTFTKADTLRGKLTPQRSYDINYYHLDVKIDIDNKFIIGTNIFKFTATQDLQRLQFDLFGNLAVDKVIYKGKELAFQREFNAVFIDFPRLIRRGTKDEFTVYYSGNPLVAKRAPWDGGFTFAQDKQGKPWVGVSCQGLGASSWWPTKDHQSDEVDSMMISVSVPDGLMDISNGRLRSTKKLNNGFTRYDWFVSYPINNYSVTLNIADYVHFDDIYNGENGNLTLDYYVLRENLDKARKQFGANVKPMLKVFENWFGPYPFYRDGFKLIDAPYLGMEHQSAVAYGNKYLNGYMGTDLSGTGYGLKWDYIIIHEAGHEWFGNNITSKDIADMWIHEGFTMYSEGLYVESLDGKKAGAKYLAGVRKKVRNDSPIIGPYDVNTEGSGDMYYKGANLVHTLRTLVDDDVKWRSILRGLNKDFGLKTTTTVEVVNYINAKSGKDLTKVFEQYLRYISIPELEYKTSSGTVKYRWNSEVPGFNMPVRILMGNKNQWIQPTTAWKTLKLKSAFTPDIENFFITVKQAD